MKYMLDTNICIYAITYGELMHGVEKSQSIEKKRITPTLFLSPITILEYRRFYGKEKLLANAGQMPERAVRYSMGVFLSRLAMNILIVFVIFIATKSYKAKKMHVDRPKDFEPVQKKTFRLLITCSAVIVVCVTLGMLFPESEICQTLSAIGQPQIVMTFGAIIAMLMKVGPADKAVKALPVNTVLMISGFTMMLAGCPDQEAQDKMSNQLIAAAVTALLSGAVLAFLGFLTCLPFRNYPRYRLKQQ